MILEQGQNVIQMKQIRKEKQKHEQNAVMNVQRMISSPNNSFDYREKNKMEVVAKGPELTDLDEEPKTLSTNRLCDVQKKLSQIHNAVTRYLLYNLANQYHLNPSWRRDNLASSFDGMPKMS